MTLQSIVKEHTEDENLPGSVADEIVTENFDNGEKENKKIYQEKKPKQTGCNFHACILNITFKLNAVRSVITQCIERKKRNIHQEEQAKDIFKISQSMTLSAVLPTDE